MTDPQDEQIKEVRRILAENQTRAFDKEAAYANLILIAGYAGAFTIWNFTRAQMTPKGIATVALLLAASLTVFVFFEIYKMGRFMTEALKVRELVLKHPQPADFLN